MSQRIDTGVAWCALNLSKDLELLLAVARERERPVSSCVRMPARAIAAAGVDAAEDLARSSDVSDAELVDLCLKLRGEPWSQAPARRGMRERMRILKRLSEGSFAVPSTTTELLALWTEANSGEVALYSEAETARLRTRTPFAHGKIPFEHKALDPGRATVDVRDLPREVENLVAFMARDDIPVECHAAASLFALWYVHPFPDGNGHVGRMLACDMLAGLYSTPTLLAFVRTMRSSRERISQTIAGIVGEQGDLLPFAELFLELPIEATTLAETDDQGVLVCSRSRPAFCPLSRGPLRGAEVPPPQSSKVHAADPFRCPSR